jgi:hypothetical protein
MSKRWIFLILMLCLIGCGALKNKKVTTDPTKDFPVLESEKCGEMCSHLKQLGCEEGEPLPDGTSCEDFCKSMGNNGHNLNISCILSIKECSELSTKCGQ